jgi:protein-tyrosine sulfotransferase
MARDGRATVHSIISRKVTITGFNLQDYGESLKRWNKVIQKMFVQCQLLGSDKCLLVYYEQLVLHPEKVMRKVLKFLDIPWNDNVLHHEKFVNKTHGVKLSKCVDHDRISIS